MDGDSGGRRDVGKDIFVGLNTGLRPSGVPSRNGEGLDEVGCVDSGDGAAEFARGFDTGMVRLVCEPYWSRKFGCVCDTWSCE